MMKTMIVVYINKLKNKELKKLILKNFKDDSSDEDDNSDEED